jgi:hypothetical protein
MLPQNCFPNRFRSFGPVPPAHTDLTFNSRQHRRLVVSTYAGRRARRSAPTRALARRTASRLPKNGAVAAYSRSIGKRTLRSVASASSASSKPNVNLDFSFASAEALSRALSCSARKGDVVLQFTQSGALPLQLDQRLLRLRLFGFERSDLVLRRGDVLFQVLFHFLRRLADLSAHRGEICLFGHHLRVGGANDPLGRLNRGFGGRHPFFQASQNLKIGVRRIVRQVSVAARQAGLQRQLIALSQGGPPLVSPAR